ncbi:TonB-dependent receptor [Colwelliaceae bacterium 6441]
MKKLLFFRFLFVCALMISTLAYTKETLQKKFNFNINKTVAEHAIIEFAEQGKLTFFLPFDLIKGKNVNEVKGIYTVNEALKLMLNETEVIAYIDEHSRLIITIDELKAEMQNMINSIKGGIIKKNNLAGALIAAIASFGSTAYAQEGNEVTTAEKEKEGVEVITVTASFREQTVLEVPSAIQVFSGDELERKGATGFENYVLSIPAVSFRDQGSGTKRVTLRGVSNISSNDFGAPTSANTVGIYLNDVPLQGTNSLPDLSLFDLERVEVLKGPQGTLYGDGAMGGAIKMITKAPDTEFFEAKFASTVSSTQNGGMNFDVNAAINVPLIEERLAARFVMGLRDKDGFIDNIATGEDDANSSNARSFRATVLANITDETSVEVMMLKDISEVDEHTQINADLGDLEFDGLEDRYTNYEVDLFALTIKHDFGFAELTSVTSQYERERDQVDRSDFGLAPGVTRSPYVFVEQNQAFAQELRLVSTDDNSFNWVIGTMYRDKERFSDFGLAVDKVDLPILDPTFRDGLFGRNEYQSQDILENYKQIGIYGEINYQVTEQLEGIFGARWYKDNNSMSVMQIPGSLFVFPPVLTETEDKGFLFKAGLSYALSEDHHLYLTAAEGYRTSAPNSNADFAGPLFAAPGELWNYELGLKTQWADGRVKFNASTYFIDWSNFQALVQEFVPLFGFDLSVLDNGGDAEVKGIELEFAAAITDELTVGATAGFVDSEVVDGKGGFTTGMPLPNTADTTASAYLEYRTEIGEGMGIYARADMNYVDDQTTLGFTATETTGVPIEGYTMGNLRIGIDKGSFGISFFVDNITDERAQLGRGLAGGGNNLDSNRFTISRPRTIGLTVRYDM